MNDILHRLDALRRPRLLIRTARIGAEDYRRDVHLPRLLGHGGLPRNASALERLMEIEAVLDQSRRDGATGYSTIRHVEVMIAMMGEARLLRALHPPLTQRPAIAIAGDAILEPLA